MNIFYREDIFKKHPNKNYCIQWQINKPRAVFVIRNSFNISENGITYDFVFFDLISFYVGWTRKEDHAGFTFTFSFFGLCLHNSIHDTRHWNHETDTWQVYPKEK